MTGFADGGGVTRRGNAQWSPGRGSHPVAAFGEQVAQDEPEPEHSKGSRQNEDEPHQRETHSSAGGRVSLIEIKGKVNRKVFQVTVPTGRLMAPGVGLQVDGGKAQKVNYAVCLPDRCVAEVPLTDSIIASFKKGGELTLTSVNFQNKPNPIKVSLQGFTDAFDGPPLQQSDIEERQKKLQDFVSKNNEDFAKKLKEEQEKAKASE
jgi:hypothetical protein